ncbi:MAG: SDR family NAD(P)-dependent oxidoreductase [Pseudomonadota bacterium]
MKHTTERVAFVTGASRGIGAETAVALAHHGYQIALTARTLDDGQSQTYVGSTAALPGSLRRTAAKVRAAGGDALCLQADILDPDSMSEAVHQALTHFGRVDLLCNNAVYQGTGNLEPLLSVNPDQLLKIYQGNVFTPLALVQSVLPGMLERRYGTVINMVSHSAFVDPPAPADQGGWGFAYPSSKAALSRMVASLRVEHADSGLRAFNIEPGLVVTEVMRMAGIDESVVARFKPCTAASIGAVLAWLAGNEPQAEWYQDGVLRAPLMAKALGLLSVPSQLEETQ